MSLMRTAGSVMEARKYGADGYGANGPVGPWSLEHNHLGSGVEPGLEK